VPTRAWLQLSLTAAILTSGAVAQTPSASETTVTAHTELVTLSVVVTNHAGVHIDDLNKDDFTLLEDGKEQKIAIFEKIKKTTGSLPHTSAHPNQFSNVRANDASLTQMTIIVLDMINTPVQDQIHAETNS